MLPRHSWGPCLHETPSSSSVTLVELVWRGGVSGDREDSPSDVRQLKVDFVADILHRWQDHVMQAVASVGAFAHDESLEWHAARAIGDIVFIPGIDGNDRHAEDQEEENQPSDAEHDSLVPLARRRLGPGAHVRSLGFVDILLELGERGFRFGGVVVVVADLMLQQGLFFDLAGFHDRKDFS